MLILFVLLSASYFQVEAFESSDEKSVEKFLSNFYDYNEKSDKLSDAVKNIQKMAGLPTDGKITKELLAHVEKSRCGGKDSKKKSKRYNAAQSKWDKGQTYRFYIHDERHPTTMSLGEIQRALIIALNYWSTAADIYFGKVSSKQGSMFSLSFADAEHKMYDVHNNFAESRDPYPLDNVPGNVLAHAFFPKSGNLHFDSAEEWTEGKDDGINLRVVAAHEMGHAIGLYHSNDPKALMAPWYGGYISESDFRLPDDDSQGAISLYGNTKNGKRFVRSDRAKREQSSNQKELCNTTNINSAFQFADGHVYVVTGNNKVFRILLKNHSLIVDPAFKTIQLSNQIFDSDALLYDYSGRRFVVFKGNKIFSANGLELENMALSELNITRFGAFQGRVNAAFVRDKAGKSNTLKFWALQDGELIAGRVKGNQVKFSRRTTKLSEILKMPTGTKTLSNIDGAFVLGKKDNKRLILFVGNSVYVGNPNGRKLVKYSIPAQYPKTFKQIIHC
uniref:Mmp2 protein n=1 Tax=Schmidtea mediterranea TaxID=79327 RepID=K0JBI8_SCHMD|nr:mmp2 protein [Schmidtea mediterranea]